MTTELSPSIYMRKAESDLESARLLLEADHTDDACNRAYYAMFDAAHAAPFALGVEEIKAPIKTHNGLVAKFGPILSSATTLRPNMTKTSTPYRDSGRLPTTAEITSAAPMRPGRLLAEALLAAIKAKFVL